MFDVKYNSENAQSSCSSQESKQQKKKRDGLFFSLITEYATHPSLLYINLWPILAWYIQLLFLLASIVIFFLPLHCKLRCMHFCISIVWLFGYLYHLWYFPKLDSWNITFCIDMRQNDALLCWQTIDTMCNWPWLTKLLHFQIILLQVQHILIWRTEWKRIKEYDVSIIVVSHQSST